MLTCIQLVSYQSKAAILQTQVTQIKPVLERFPDETVALHIQQSEELVRPKKNSFLTDDQTTKLVESDHPGDDQRQGQAVSLYGRAISIHCRTS